MQTELTRPGGTRDVIAEEIKRDIISGTLNLGQRIPEAEYARRFNVSRTPVREAVLSLGTLGLVEIKSRSGSYVVQFDRASLSDLFAARFHLEASAVRYATPRARKALLKQLSGLHRQMARPHSSYRDYDLFHDADTLFHRALVQSSGSAQLLTLYAPIEVCALAARARLDKSRRVTGTASEHHAGIIAAIRDGAIDSFEETLHAHLDWVHDMLREVLRL